MPFNRLQFRSNRRLVLLGLGILLALLYGGSRGFPAVSAAGPTAVDLLYFRGEGGDNVAYLEWETGTEADTAGFQVERGPSTSGPFTLLDGIGLIPARGSVSAGAEYEATDETALNGRTYFYKLVELTADNSVGGEWIARVEVQAEPTAQVIGGGATAASRTPVPTSTTAPTATDNPGATATRADGSGGEATATNAPATNTPRPAITRQAEASPTAGNSAAGSTRAPATTATATTAQRETEGGAAVTALAQADLGAPDATPPGGYPAPEIPENPVNAPGSGDSARAAEAAADNEEDVPLLGGRAIGSEEDADATGEQESAQQEEAESSSLLLWVGFLAALFIFGGGIAISIYLSTRKRRSDLP